MPWLALTLQVDPADAEAFSEALLDVGARSVSLDGLDDARQWVHALLDAQADAARIVAEAARSAGINPAPNYGVSRLEDEDWMRRTQAQFTPMQVGARLWVAPTWCTPPTGIEAVVRLDPGLAFGTGAHPTTQLMLRFLEKRVRGGERVLDYGCGSGILAIAAAKLGASQVDAIDVDPEAVRTAAANAIANGVEMRTGLPEELSASQFDLVVSNILAQPLIVLAPLLAARTARAGRLALAGVLDSQAAEVSRAYDAWFDLSVTRVDDGWALIEGSRK